MSDHATHLNCDGSTRGRLARTQRWSVMLIAVLEYPGGEAPTKHRVRDISLRGMRIDNAGGLQPNSSVLISVGALQAIRATVKWARHERAGLAFAEDINAEDARKKAAGAASATANVNQATTLEPLPVPTAGWVGEMRNPYRK